MRPREPGSTRHPGRSRPGSCRVNGGRPEAAARRALSVPSIHALYLRSIGLSAPAVHLRFKFGGKGHMMMKIALFWRQLTYYFRYRRWHLRCRLNGVLESRPSASIDLKPRKNLEGRADANGQRSAKCSRIVLTPGPPHPSRLDSEARLGSQQAPPSSSRSAVVAIVLSFPHHLRQLLACLTARLHRLFIGAPWTPPSATVSPGADQRVSAVARRTLPLPLPLPLPLAVR